MKTAFLVLTLLAACPVWAAAPESTIGETGCKVVDPRPLPNESIKWSGACKDGYADGAGKLDWFVSGQVSSQFEGSLVRGVAQGEGYSNRINGTQYEGNFKDGLPDGKGISLNIDQTRYEGQFRAGRPDGAGTISYATGGRYAGQWKQGKYHGQGKATYIGGQVIEGEFIDGRTAGTAPDAAGTADPKNYGMNSGDDDHGSKGFRQRIAGGGSVPFGTSYPKMSKAQQRFIRSHYPLLHETDEPPYPLNGTAPIIDFISTALQQMENKKYGVLTMHVLVDSKGFGTTVTVFSSPFPEIGKIAAFAARREMYKPGLCAGTPCAMIYPFSAQLTRN